MLPQIDEDITVVHQRTHRGELRIGGHVGTLVEEAPQLHQRTDGDVERAAAVGTDLPRGLEHTQHRLAHFDRGSRGRHIDVKELAVRSVIAHQSINFCDGRECFLDRLFARGFVTSERLYLNRRAHQVAERSRLAVVRISAHRYPERECGHDAKRDVCNRRGQGAGLHLQPQPPLCTPYPPAAPSRASCQCAM